MSIVEYYSILDIERNSPFVLIGVDLQLVSIEYQELLTMTRESARVSYAVVRRRLDYL